MASQVTGKETWEKFVEADGFISKNINEVIADLEIGDYDEEKEMIESLNIAMNYYDVEFENEREERWRFKN